MKRIFTLIVTLILSASFTMSAQAAAAFVIGKDCSYGLGYHANDMHAAINAAYYYCKKNNCADPMLRGSADGQGYSAVAVGTRHDGCYYGFALNQTSREEATRLAMMHCTKYGSCSVNAWCFGDQCKTNSHNLPKDNDTNTQPKDNKPDSQPQDKNTDKQPQDNMNSDRE